MWSRLPPLRLDDATDILAAVVVTIANGAGAQLRPILGHLRIIDRDYYGRHPNETVHGLHDLIPIS